MKSKEPLIKTKYVSTRGTVQLVDVMMETEKAMLLRGPSKKTAWFPKSGLYWQYPKSGDDYLKPRPWFVRAVNVEQFYVLEGI